MLTDEQLKNHMRKAFCDELDFGATCAFDELTKEEQDRIIGIGDDQEWGDLDDASYRGGQYNDELTDDQKTAAIRRFYESGGLGSKQYTNYLPADTVEYYHLHDIIKARGWVRHTGEHIDGYYPPEAIERMKLKEEQDRIDARDLEIGRNLGPTLSRIEKTAVETRQGVGVLVSKLPDAKKPTVISWAEATAIFYPSMAQKTTEGDFAYTDEEKRKLIDSFSRNCRNWIKAKRTPIGTPIAWDDLKSIQTWTKWVEQYRADEYKPDIVSGMAGITIGQRGRKRSPTAQSGK